MTTEARERDQGVGALSARVAVRLAWGMWALSVMLATAAVVLGLSGNGDLVIVLSVAVSGLVFGATGALVASRVPRNPIGWIFCVLALLFEFSVCSDAYVAYNASQANGFLPGTAWFGWTSQWSTNALVPALIILCFLLFPTGRLLSARWRAVVWVVVGVAAVHAASVALAPGTLVDYPIENPAGIESAGALRALAEASILVLVIPLMLLSVVSLFVRLRRSSGPERQQLKWFAYAAALLATELVVVNGLALLGGAIEREASELVLFLVFLVVLSGIPVAMGVAILKYRLYDIDVIINRTLVYGSLTVTLVVLYLGGVATVQGVFRALTRQEDQPQLAIVVSTLVIAALFNPLRKRIQSFIDRRFYRRKYDAAKTLEDFSAKLRDETDLEALRDELVSVVREAMQPKHASVWLRPDRSPPPERAD